MDKYLSLYQSFFLSVLMSKYFLETSSEEQTKIINFLGGENFKGTCDSIEERVTKIFEPSLWYKK